MKNGDEVAIFWDYENCPAPTNTSGYAIVNNIRSIAQTFGSVKLFKAYLEVAERVPMSRAVLLRSELQSSGVSLTDCPHNGRKDVADKMILVDMLAHAIDNVAPSTIVLISGDRDFAYALSILRFRGYRIVLVTLSNAHQSLRAQASISFDWVSEVLELVDPTLSNQPTSPPSRRGKISSSPAQDKFCSDSMGPSHNPSTFQEPYSNEKSANCVEFMNNFQDETRCTENSRTPSKHDAKHDSLPSYLERRFSASSMALNNGSEPPGIVVHSSVAFSSCHTHPSGSIQTPLDTTACSSDSESNFASRTIQTQTRLLRLLQTLQESPREASCHRDAPSENPPLIRESSPLSHQQGSPSPINTTRHPSLSSVDQMVIDDNAPANVTAKVTLPTTPSLIPPSITLSSTSVSAINQIPEIPLQPTPSPFVADDFKILVQCLESHRRSRGSLSTLRSKLGLKIDENGTTYRMSGVNRRRHTSSISVPDKFKILIRCLKSHRSRGNLYPLRRKVSSEIAQNGITYQLAGVSTFGEYVMIAEKAGIVEVGGSESTAWIALKAPWYNVPCDCYARVKLFPLLLIGIWNFGQCLAALLDA